jgi:hypothetical protein
MMGFAQFASSVDKSSRKSPSRKGLRIYFNGMWAQLAWPVQWELSGILTDITFLELFPVVVALNIWGYYLRNKKII